MSPLPPLCRSSHRFTEVWLWYVDGENRVWPGCSCGWVSFNGGRPDNVAARAAWEAEHMSTLPRPRVEGDAERNSGCGAAFTSTGIAQPGATLAE